MKRAKPLADMVAPILGPALAAQGFTGYDLVAAWPDIVGERLAARSRPLKVEWPRRRPGAGRDERGDPATLLIRVESAFALEAQHLAPLLIERINAVYGWRCVSRIVLKQGPVTIPSRSGGPGRAPNLDEARRVAEAASRIADASLSGALARLGHAIMAAEPAHEPAPEPRSPVLPGQPTRISPNATDDGAFP